MRILRTTIVLVCAALGIAAAAHARPPAAPPVTWLKGEGNYTKAHRAPQTIDAVVVHVTEGTFWGSIQWLRSDRSHASSHFIVSRRGKIIQLVHQSDIAWHAGNWRVNKRSVGVEHEGVTDDPAGFTGAQYRASARLVAYIARRSLLPIDRKHIIGHDEVPDPGDPGAYGGADNHTDPGSTWRWNAYLKLVRKHAYVQPRRPAAKPAPKRQPKPKPKPKPKPRPQPPRVGVASATVYSGQTVRGVLPLRARTSGPVHRVDFAVDGRIAHSDRNAPFAARLPTLRLGNGRHVLELRAYGPRGVTARRRVVIRVHNLPFAVALRAPAGDVAGVAMLQAAVTGARARSVELRVDGRRVTADSRPPYAFGWNTRGVRDGRHTLELHAVAVDGRRTRTRATVVVSNVLRLVSHSLAEGQPVSGLVAWEVRAAGPVARVEFAVDGVFRGNATAAPYTLTWDTTPAAAGPHVLAARIVGRNGKSVSAAVTVVVAPPPAE